MIIMGKGGGGPGRENGRYSRGETGLELGAEPILPPLGARGGHLLPCTANACLGTSGRPRIEVGDIAFTENSVVFALLPDVAKSMGEEEGGGG